MNRTLGKCAAVIVLAGLASCSALGIGPAEKPGYAVFFTEKSPVLEPQALAVIQRAADEARARPDTVVTVLGWTDTGANAQFDLVLSRQRAQAVADTLVADGVAASRIERHGRGQTHEDPGIESRRVDIYVGS